MELSTYGVRGASSRCLCHRAALVRTGSWPRLTVAEELPEPVGRMAAVYQRHRTPQPDAPVVQVLPLETKADGPAIFAAADGVSDTGTLTVEHHALTAHVNWESVTRVAPAQPDQHLVERPWYQ